MGNAMDPFEFGDRAEGSVFDAIADNSSCECRTDHWQRSEFVHAGKIEIDRRAGPSRCAITTDCWRLDVVGALARGHMITRVEREPHRIEVQAAIPVRLSRIARKCVSWCTGPRASARSTRRRNGAGWLGTGGTGGWRNIRIARARSRAGGAALARLLRLSL